jgi:adenylate cyclase
MTEDRVKRKLSAIFSADVEGYSRLMGEDEVATVRTLENYRTVMVDLIEQHRGRVVDSPGDNLLAEFGSVVDAVQCAVEIQQIVKAKNAELPENRRMQFRIGVNLGDVIEEGERIYGDGVNIAARIEGLAEGGGICVSGSAYEQIENKLALGYEYLGEHAVKNIAKPVRVYKVPMELGPRKEKKAGVEHWKKVAVTAAAVIIIVAGAFAIWKFYFRPPPIEPASVEKMAFPLPEKPSIAVLPFVNMSGDPKQEYFSDGITEEIITALSKTPKMLVIARNSTFTYKGKPVKVSRVAEELGVRYVLEGSVRKAEKRVRITAQLIDALTGHHLWAERYDRDLKDIFALQDEITIKIIGALQVKLTEGEIARVTARGTQNLEAYLKVLQAQKAFFTVTKEGMAQTRRLCEEAIALDPEYAVAYGFVGTTHWMEVLLGASKSPKKSLKLAFKFLEKTKAMNDSLPISQLGYLYFMTKQYDKGIAECERALALAPNSGKAHIWMALILYLSGRHEEAVRHAEQALRLDPLGPAWYLRTLGTAYSWVGRYEEAIAAYKKSLQRSPNDLFTHLSLTAAYTWAGRLEDARAQVDEVVRINPKYCLEKATKAASYKNQADRERYLDALRKAGLPETPPLPLPDKPSIAVLPFVNMSDDPKQEYFSDGISEEIITALSKSSHLFVISRESTFSYKGKQVKVQQIARELGVRYILEGSVRKSEDRVRITAQLIDSIKGEHLWSERYDRDLKDIFALQDEITMKIVTALQIKLTEGEQARMWAKKYKNRDVYLKQMEALSLWRKGTKESLIRFGQLGQEIIDMAPESSYGYKALAWYNWSLALIGKSPRESIGKAFQLAQKALSLDESDAYSHALLGSIYLMMRKYEKAIVAGERSIELDPNGAMLHGLLGMTLSFAGRPDEAIVHLNQGIRLNPFPAYWYFFRLGQSYIQKGQYEEALTAYKKGLQRAPNAWANHLHLAVIYVLLDRQEEAGAAAKKVLELYPNFSVERISKTLPYKNQAHLKLFVDAMRKAGLK